MDLFDEPQISTAPILREFQTEQRSSIHELWKENQSVLLVSSVGSGKTTVFSQIAVDRIPSGRVLIAAHRSELISQAYNRIALWDIIPEIEKAEEIASHSEFASEIVIATVQTLKSAKRLRRFDPKQFSTLIWDEAHHCTSASYRKIQNYFCEGNPDLRVLGVTGTPDRADEEALGQVFDVVAEPVYGIEKAIADGWLVEPLQQFVQIDSLDLSEIHTVAGDFNVGELSAILEREENAQAIADATFRIAGNRATLVFAASVKEAEMISDILNRHEAGCSRWICGKTPDKERSESFRDFKNREFRFFCNVGIMTEGTDLPFVEVIANARPTKSRALYEQINGRALRVLPGVVEHCKTKEERLEAIANSPKAKALLIDFVGNSGRHKLMTVADILGGELSDAFLEELNDRMRSSGKPKSVSEEIARLKADIEIRAAKERERRKGIRARAEFSAREVSPFDVYDSFAYVRGWDKSGACEAQCAYLSRRGHQHPERYTKRQASAIIAKTKESEANARGGLGMAPSPKQLWHLVNSCHLTNAQVDSMPFSQWKGILDNYFANK